MVRLEPAPSGVLFSHDIFSAQATGGISRCMIETMAALTAAGAPWSLWAGRHHNRLLDRAVRDGILGPHVVAARLMPTSQRVPRAIVNEIGFARDAPAHDARVIHRTYYPLLDLAGHGRRQVHTLHDMWDERAPNRSASTRLRSVLKLRAVASADAIVCVSDYTRQEAIALVPALAGRLTVIPHGVRRLSAAPAFAADRPFFLFVGQRGSYKNFAVAVGGLAGSNAGDHDLVCFGGGAFTAGEQAMLAASGMAARVRQCSGSDDALAGAYELATALLYPSLYEGFGLPLLEAMIHGCVVIAAPLTALPETGGDAVLYADAHEPLAWAAAIDRVVTDTTLVVDLRQRGYARARTFTWARSAAAHAALYATLA